MLKRLVINLIKYYRKIVSPLLAVFLGGACKFNPTCSVYAISKIEKHGVARGGLMSLKRFLKCNPWN